MEVPLAVLADSANVSQEGKLNIMGIFSQIDAPSLPHQHSQMALVIAMEVEVGQEHQAGITCMDADGGTLLEATATIEVPIQDSTPRTTVNHIINLQQFEFPREGDYSFRILLNGELKRSVPLTVKLAD